MARERDNFVISDVDSFYFGGYGGDDVLTGEDVTSYIYTDRQSTARRNQSSLKGFCQWTSERLQTDRQQNRQR